MWMVRSGSLVGSIAVWVVAGPAGAQIVLDGTTGPAGSLAGPDYEIGAELGTRAGDNLFHSFAAFDLRTVGGQSERATFSGPDAIQNVIARVTGGSASTIDGTLRSTMPNADLFFINPAGVVFGSNASLEVPGSFHVSTADELRFEDGARFNARNPDASSFTMATPESFGFLGAEPGAITIDGSELIVEPGETLSFVGGDIVFNGGIPPAVGPGGIFVFFFEPERGIIAAPAGRLHLLAVRGEGEADPQTGLVDAAGRADITLTDQAAAGANGDGAGDVVIFGDRVELAIFSQITSINTGPTDSQSAVRVDASQLIVRDAAVISSGILGDGDGSDIDITAGRVEVSGDLAFFFDGMGFITAGISADNSRFLDDSSLAGDVGTITIRASDVLLSGSGSISSSNSANGQAGLIDIMTDDLHILGDPGPLFVLDGFEFSNLAGIFTDADGASSQAGGTIRIAATNDVQIVGNGIIRSGTSGMADAGRIEIEAQNMLLRGIDPDAIRGIASNADSTSTGNGGTIVVTVRDELRIEPGGSIGSATFSSGDGGRIQVNAGALMIDGRGTSDFTGITAQGASGDFGNAGSLEINAHEITVRGGTIRSSTFGLGLGGDITITADDLLLDDGEISAIAAFNDAGTIALDVENAVRMTQSDIATQSAFGGGGGIVINVEQLLDLDDSQITSSVRGADGTTDAGNISIDPEFVILGGDSEIGAQATAGTGGNITIIADQLLVGPDATIDASAETGIDGEIVVSSPEVDLSGGLVEVEATLLDATSLLRQACASRTPEQFGTFTSSQRGGIPAGPEAPLTAYAAAPPEAAGARIDRAALDHAKEPSC